MLSFIYYSLQNGINSFMGTKSRSGSFMNRVQFKEEVQRVIAAALQPYHLTEDIYQLWTVSIVHYRKKISSGTYFSEPTRLWGWQAKCLPSLSTIFITTVSKAPAAGTGGGTYLNIKISAMKNIISPIRDCFLLLSSDLFVCVIDL